MMQGFLSSNREQKRIIVRRRSAFQGLLRLHRIIDGIADYQDLCTGTRSFQGALGCVVEVSHVRMRLDPHGLLLVVLAGGDHGSSAARRADRRVRDSNGIIERGGGLDGLPAAVMQPTMAGIRAERGRHQEGIPAGSEVGVEQRFEDDGHVGVGGVHFVDDQEVSGQTRRSHVRVLDLERAHHRLVDGADGDLGGEEALRTLGRPRFFVRVVVPPLVVVLHVGAFLARLRVVARNGEDDGGRVRRWKEAVDEALDALVDLDCGGASRQGEIEAVYQFGSIHGREAPEGGLRFAGSGLRLDDDEPLVQRR